MNPTEVLLLIFGSILLFQLNAIRRLLLSILTELLRFKSESTEGLEDFKKELTKQLTLHGSYNFASGLQESIEKAGLEATEVLQSIDANAGEITSSLNSLDVRLLDIEGKLGAIESNTTPINHEDPLS